MKSEAGTGVGLREGFEKWYLTTPLVDERPKSILQWEAWQAASEITLQYAEIIGQVCEDLGIEPDADDLQLKIHERLVPAASEITPHNLRNCPAMRALERLTPGGSEYVDDIPRCVATVREYRDSLMKVLVDTKKQLHASEIAPTGNGLSQIALEISNVYDHQEEPDLANALEIVLTPRQERAARRIADEQQAWIINIGAPARYARILAILQGEMGELK